MMKTQFLSAFLASLMTISAWANTSPIKTTALNANVHMLEGQGGNIAVIESDTALYVVDTQFANIYPDIKNAINQISPKPVRYVINTHGHNDHTNGNESFVKDFNATIIAHHNTTDLIDAYNQNNDKPNTLPHLTFNQSLKLMGNEPIHLIYFANAHTNGDIIVHLPKSNIIHAGDILFFGRFPFIDVKNGGTIDGMINGLNGIISLADDQTKIIAGHGNLASRNEVIKHTEMLTTIKKRIEEQKNQGKTLAEIQASHPAQEWESSHNWNFINHEKLVEAIYRSLK